MLFPFQLESVSNRFRSTASLQGQVGDFTGKLAITSFGCTLIALLLWTLAPSLNQFGFLRILVHSQCIGLSIMLLCTLFGWLQQTLAPSNLLSFLANGAGTVLGFTFGLMVARLVLG